MTVCFIDTIAFGGEGIARIDGFVYFIPFTLPSETVEMEVSHKKRSFGQGKLLRVLSSHPERVVAPCAYFTVCGGCQLQHASYPLQLGIKKKWIEESLKKIGKICIEVPPIEPSPHPFGYRRHITLGLHLSKESYKLGFISLDGAPISIDSCLLLHDPEDKIIRSMQTIFSSINTSASLENSTVKIIKTTTKKYFIAVNFKGTISPQEIQVIQNFLENHPDCEGFSINSSIEKNTDCLHFFYKNFRFNYSPSSFVQNHPEQSSKIYDQIVDIHQKAKKILDLYSGIGVSSIAIAGDGKKVVGIESNKKAVSLARHNVKQNNINHQIEFICDNAEKQISDILSSFDPDAVIVNPPRIGLSSEVLNAIAESSAVSITYISCNPTTLARDLAYLLGKGFLIKSIKGFDMFPQTTHVETLVELEKSPLI